MTANSTFNRKIESWSSYEEFFNFLNNNIRYVIMRNFDDIPSSFYAEEHTDIDLLLYDISSLLELVECKKIYNDSFRVQYTVKINNEDALFDFRYVGDGYYDEEWEKNILECRVLYNGVYVPNRENYKYMLLYHALIHKYLLPTDYKRKLSLLFPNDDQLNVLQEFLKKRNYSVTKPNDLSVYYNWKNSGKIIPFFRIFRRRLYYLGCNKGKKK